MINGLGVLGWGVGGIEAESVMLGQAISMVLPEVVGFKLEGNLRPETTATDLVLTITQMLRKRGVVGKFVEFYGSGCNNLTIADRATIANMAPEYGATCGFFPVDNKTIDYLKLTSRKPDHVDLVEKYLKAQGLFRQYDGSQVTPTYSGDLMSLDLAAVQPSLSGPKRPHDRVDLKSMKSDFTSALTNPVGFKGYGMKPADTSKTVKFTYKGEEHTL